MLMMDFRNVVKNVVLVYKSERKNVREIINVKEFQNMNQDFVILMNANM